MEPLSLIVADVPLSLLLLLERERLTEAFSTNLLIAEQKQRPQKINTKVKS